MPGLDKATLSFSHHSSALSLKCANKPPSLKVSTVHSRCTLPAEILELIIHEAFSSERSFSSISGFASASYAFRQIALRCAFAYLHISSPKCWNIGLPDVRDLARWVRSLRGAAQALIVPEAINLNSFRLLRTVHVHFTTHTLANIARTVFPLLDNLPAELTELSLTDLPDVNFRVLNAIAQKFCLLQKLELDCAERLDTSCCWDCFEESASCIWHSPIPDMFAGPEDIATNLKNILRPLTKLEHLHLGIFLSQEEIFYEHVSHALDFFDSSDNSKPFGPEWCTVCFDHHAPGVRLAELQASLVLAQVLRELRTVTWASYFGRQLQEMDGRCTTIWVFRKEGVIRVRRKPWNKALRNTPTLSD